MSVKKWNTFVLSSERWGSNILEPPSQGEHLYHEIGNNVYNINLYFVVVPNILRIALYNSQPLTVITFIWCILSPNDQASFFLNLYTIARFFIQGVPKTYWAPKGTLENQTWIFCKFNFNLNSMIRRSFSIEKNKFGIDYLTCSKLFYSGKLHHGTFLRPCRNIPAFQSSNTLVYTFSAQTNNFYVKRKGITCTMPKTNAVKLQKCPVCFGKSASPLQNFISLGLHVKIHIV